MAQRLSRNQKPWCRVRFVSASRDALLQESRQAMTHSTQSPKGIQVLRNSVAQAFAKSRCGWIAAAILLPVGLATPAMSQTLGYAGYATAPSRDRSGRATVVADPNMTEDESDSTAVLPERLQRKIVSYETRERRAPLSSIPATQCFTTFSVRAVRSAMASALDAKGSWSGVQRCRARRRGPTGIRPQR